MPTYNMSQVASESKTLAGLFQSVSHYLLNDLLGVGVLVLVTFVFGLSFYQGTNDVHKAVLGSLAVSVVVSIFLRIVNLLSDWLMYLVIVGAACMYIFFVRQT